MTPTYILKGHTNSVNCVVSGQHVKTAEHTPSIAHHHHVLSGSDDHTARLWDIRTHKPQRCLKGCKDPITHVAFSPTSEHEIYVAADNQVRKLHNGDSLHGRQKETICLMYCRSFFPGNDCWLAD
jgi:WD40 repeat protein